MAKKKSASLSTWARLKLAWKVFRNPVLAGQAHSKKHMHLYLRNRITGLPVSPELAVPYVFEVPVLVTCGNLELVIEKRGARYTQRLTRLNAAAGDTVNVTLSHSWTGMHKEEMN